MTLPSVILSAFVILTFSVILSEAKDLINKTKPTTQ